MKTFSVKTLVLLLFEILAACVSASAGTIITDNLPPNTVIVNIAGNVDYAAGYDADKGHWYSPGSTQGPSHILQYTFQAGTYAFRIVDPADAAQLFPTLTATQANQIYSAWTFNSPWVTTYDVFDSSATNNPSMPELFDGASGTNYGNAGIPFYGNAQAAYDASIANGSYKLIRTGPAGYDSLNFTTSYTITTTETLIFVIPDQGPGDNNGGVSVLVTKIDDLTVNWFKVAGGGGVSSDGSLTIQGTAGQPDAGAMTDGALSVRGGFWVSALQTPGAPYLNIKSLDSTHVEVYWATNGLYTLQTNSSLQPASWGAYTGSVTTLNGTNSITLIPTGNMFFRLKQ